MLTENWNEAKLSDIAEIVMGQSPKSEFYNENGKGLPFFQGITEFGNLYPMVRKWCTIKKKIAEKGDILMTVRAPVGVVNIAKERCIIGRGLCAIRPKENNGRFIFYLLRSNENYIRIYSGGTIYKSITKDSVHNLKFIIPSLKIQQKVSSFLSLFDDLIENNLQRIKILEEIAQLIFQEWFVNYHFPGHEDINLVNSGTDDKLPETWERVKLSELVSTQYGYTQSASSEEIGPKYVRGTDINKRSFINWPDVPYCEISSSDLIKYKLKKGDILIVRMADPGKSGIIEKDINAIFASYLIKLNIIKKLTPYYLFYFLQSEEYQKYIKIAATGTTRKSAAADVLTNIQVKIPNKSILLMFEEVISNLRKLLNNLVLKNEKLQKMRDLLLPKLISGQIDISEMERTIDKEERE